MKHASTLAAAAAVALCLPGCTGAMWGNLLVLGLTVGIFIGTLTLGRRAGGSTATRSDASSQSRS